MSKFRFRTPTPEAAPSPLKSQRTAAAWFRQLPAVDAIGRQQVVMQAIAAECRAARRPAFEHVGAVEYLDAELAVDRGRLFAQYVEHAEGSAALANRIWQAAYEISQGFIVAYRTLVDCALATEGDARWRAALPRLLARLVHFYGTDARLRVLRNEPWIPAKWVQLHRLYRDAAARGIQRVPLAPEGAGADTARPTIEQEYIAVLLSHLLATGTLAPAEIDWAAAQVRIWSAGLALDEAPRSTGGFVVDLGGTGGLVRRLGDGRGPLFRYLDTRPLIEQLDRAIATLRGMVAADADPASALHRQRVAILERLRPALAPEPPAVVPRDPRIDLRVVADVRFGLAAIWQELARGEPQGAASAAFGGREAAAGDELEGEVLPASAHAAASPPGERPWHIEDRSATGLRLLTRLDVGPAPPLGALVGVRGPGDERWVLGVVRRSTHPAADRIEAGVSILSSRAIAVALHAKRQAREDMSFVVDGVDVSTIGQRFDGLYLPPPVRPERPVIGKSLIVPASEYAEGRPLILITARSVYTVALREPLERHADWAWALIDVVDRAARG